jgi:hypothetical protein
LANCEIGFAFRAGSRARFARASAVSSGSEPPAGVVRDSNAAVAPWPGYVLLAGGILIIYLGFKTNRRDPEGKDVRAVCGR